MKRIWIWACLVFCAHSAFAGDPQGGTAGLLLESSQLRRGELLHKGLGYNAFGGFGDDDVGISFWGDRASGWSETGLSLRYGGPQLELALTGYQQSQDASSKTQAEASLDLRSDPAKNLGFGASYIQASTPKGRVRWVRLLTSLKLQNRAFDWTGQAILNGRDSESAKKLPYTAEGRMDFQFPGLSNWLVVSFTASSPLSPKARERIKSQSGETKFQTVSIGVGHVF